MQLFDKNPFFSVVIPLYNKAKFIEDTLKSVIGQTFEEFEIIIVDDGSTDTSLAIVSKIDDPRIIIMQQSNHGVSHARNKGIERAKGKYMALIDADDLWYPNHLEELYNTISQFPNADLICNGYEIDLGGNFIKKPSYNMPKTTVPVLVHNFFSASLISGIAHSSAVAFTKESFEDLGRFNVSFRSGQDTDLWIRFALKKTIAFNPAITACYNMAVGGSLSKSQLNWDRYNSIQLYGEESRKNSFLKKYLDKNRFSVAIRSRLNNDLELYNKLMDEIDLTNLNKKQEFLLKSPRIVVKLLYRFQKFLFKYQIYLTSHS
jgi:glycosyltransferase involved in cell wall biosynthesis